MLNKLLIMLSYDFLLYALIVGVLVSLCAAMLGCSLVLRRYSMIGDGLSHVGFGAIAIATALRMAPMAVTIPLMIVAAVLLLRVSEQSAIRGDAAIALISITALALGVFVLSVFGGSNADLSSFLFGSILSVTREDLLFSLVLCPAVLLLFLLLYNKIFALTFDEEFAEATGMRVRLYNTLMAALTAITIVLGMRMMGALLISSLLIFPAITSMRVCVRFKSVVALSSVLSMCGFALGLFVSFLYPVPPGATVVLLQALCFLVFALVGHLRAHRHGPQK